MIRADIHISPFFFRLFYLLLPAVLLGGTLKSQELEAYFDHKKFFSPKKGHFIETYFDIEGHSVKFLKDDQGAMRPNVLIGILIQDSDSSVVASKQWRLNGPPLKDSLPRDILDQQRFSLSPGDYRMTVRIADLNKDSVKSTTFDAPVQVEEKEEDPFISGIQFIDSYTRSGKKDRFWKSGLRLIPQVSRYFPGNRDELTFYAELYNTTGQFENDRFALRTYVADHHTGKRVGKLESTKVMDSDSAVVLFQSFNIEKLPSGNYDLVIELRNARNELVSRKKRFFQRNNPDQTVSVEDLSFDDRQGEDLADQFGSPDTLRERIRSLRPVADNVERGVLEDELGNMDMEAMKHFFYGFWKKRNEDNPQKAWRKYKKALSKVDRKFGKHVPKEGYETDRGRIFLKYGAPDHIADRANEPNSYPYQIWQYYKTDKYTNRKFVFYDPSLMNNDYELLHSNVPGEVSDRRWKLRLQERNSVMDDVDQNEGVDHFGGEVDEIFNNP